MRAPTIGRQILFTVSAAVATEINARRGRYNPAVIEGDKERLPAGAQGHKGNPLEEGAVIAGQVTAVCSETCVNAQFLLDGNDSWWGTSIEIAAQPTVGKAHWWDWQQEKTWTPPAPGTDYKVATDPSGPESVEWSTGGKTDAELGISSGTARPSLEGTPLSVGDTVYVKDEGNEAYTVDALDVLTEHPDSKGATIKDSMGGTRTAPYENLTRTAPEPAPETGEEVPQSIEDEALAEPDASLPFHAAADEVPPFTEELVEDNGGGDKPAGSEPL